MNTTTQRPLQNLGEILTGIQLNPAIPDLRQRYRTSQTSQATIIRPLKTTGYHRIVFCLARVKRVLHRDEIAAQCSIPIAGVACYLAKLKNENIIISPDWGYYTVSGNFLRAFQLCFGAPKTETLLKMFDEAGVDVSEFQCSLEGEDKAELATHQPDDDEQLAAVLKRLVEKKRERLAVLNTKIEQLQSEIEALRSEKGKLEAELDPLKALVLN